jgi:uncharacterized protein YndB with AHSA1/START domain
MEMYHFVTEWYFEAPIEMVWQVLEDVKSWPTWSKSFKKIVIRGPEPTLQLGSVVDCEVKGALPYTLRFSIQVTNFQPPHIIEVKSSGSLVGGGKWLLKPRNGGTVTTYYWDVGTTNPVLNILAKLPFVRAMLERNHDAVMADAYQNLKAKLKSMR